MSVADVFHRINNGAWLNGKLCVERGIVCQHVDAVKTTGSRKQMSTDSGLLEVR